MTPNSNLIIPFQTPKCVVPCYIDETGRLRPILNTDGTPAVAAPTEALPYGADCVDRTYNGDGNVLTEVFRTGGASGTIVKTITNTWTGLNCTRTLLS